MAAGHSVGAPRARKLALLLPLCCAGVRAHAHHRRCNHDAILSRNTSQPRANVAYARGHPHRRHLGVYAADTTWEPIRIHSELSTTDGTLDADHHSVLFSSILPSALEWVGKALRVVRSTAALTFDRACAVPWSNGVCAVAAAVPTCGPIGDASAVNVPDSMLNGQTVCADSASASACASGDCSGCTSTAAGTGVTADFIVFVTAVDASAGSYCGGSTLAYASICQRDQFDRPVMGHVNFCPSQVSTAEADFGEQLDTAVHELLHALGFDATSWALFREADGTPRTARDSSTGLPTPTASYTCPDGAVVSNAYVPDANTLIVGTQRGVAVHKLVTPRVVSVARDLLGCDSIDGAELENQPTAAGGCFGSHWEQRLFVHELMAPIALHVGVYSALTLAALEDSGWYQPNYTVSSPMLWLRSAGCDYVDQQCVQASSGASIDTALFCTSPSTDSSATTFACTADRTAKGFCNLAALGSGAISETEFQYFGDSSQGGALTTADFCPIVQADSNYGECTLASNAPEARSVPNYRAESFGSTSSCYESTISQFIGGLSAAAIVDTACHITHCVDGKPQVQLNLQDSSTHTLACTTESEQLIPPISLGLSGTLTCPGDFSVVCAPTLCPSRCDGGDDCNGGVCICGDAFGGEQCCGAANCSNRGICNQNACELEKPLTIRIALEFLEGPSVDIFSRTGVTLGSVELTNAASGVLEASSSADAGSEPGRLLAFTEYGPSTTRRAYVTGVRKGAIFAVIGVPQIVDSDATSSSPVSSLVSYVVAIAIVLAMSCSCCVGSCLTYVFSHLRVEAVSMDTVLGLSPAETPRATQTRTAFELMVEAAASRGGSSRGFSMRSGEPAHAGTGWGAERKRVPKPNASSVAQWSPAKRVKSEKHLARMVARYAPSTPQEDDLFALTITPVEELRTISGMSADVE